MHNTNLPIRPRDHGDDRKTRETASLREYMGEKNCGSEKNRQTKNGGAEGGGWCERELHKEVGEELAKVGWTCRKNGRGTIDEESGCDWRGGQKEGGVGSAGVGWGGMGWGGEWQTCMDGL